MWLLVSIDIISGQENAWNCNAIVITEFPIYLITVSLFSIVKLEYIPNLMKLSSPSTLKNKLTLLIKFQSVSYFLVIFLHKMGYFWSNFLLVNHCLLLNIFLVLARIRFRFWSFCLILEFRFVFFGSGYTHTHLE